MDLTAITLCKENNIPSFEILGNIISDFSKLLKKEATGLPWLGTFHSISAKLLRKHAAAVGLKSNFSIVATVARGFALSSLLWRSWQRVGLIILRSRVRSSPGAVLFLFFCLYRAGTFGRVVREFSAGFAFGWMAERSKALV